MVLLFQPFVKRIGVIILNKSVMEKSRKKFLIIILCVIAAIILFWGGWAIYTNIVVDHAYDRAEKEYNKAYDKAKKDVDRMMRDYNY